MLDFVVVNVSLLYLCSIFMWLDETRGDKRFEEQSLALWSEEAKGTQGSVWVGNRAHVIWSAHLPPAQAAALNQYSAKLSHVFTFT